MPSVLDSIRTLVTSQLFRYLLAGGAVGLTYIGLTMGLSFIMPIQMALGIALTVALSLHFALQRWFVFRSTNFSLPLSAQLRRYGLIAAVQYPLSTAATTWLPRWTNISEQAAYLAITVVISLVSFVMLRSRVFRSS